MLNQHWLCSVSPGCCANPVTTGESGSHRTWLLGTEGRLQSCVEGGRVVSWRVQALNEQSVDLALILIGSKLSFGSPDGWQEARPGTQPRRKRDVVTFPAYINRVKLIVSPIYFVAFDLHPFLSLPSLISFIDTYTHSTYTYANIQNS